MQLTVERDSRFHQAFEDLVLLPAKDGARRSYVVAIASAEWDTLVRRHGDDAAVEVDSLTSEGRWETRAGRRVLRVRR